MKQLLAVVCVVAFGSVALADDKEVRAWNKRDRAKDKPTNVLSYPSGEKRFLGDVVLARQTVWREAREQKKTPADHLVHLVVHGTLHLLGHDHETILGGAFRLKPERAAQRDQRQKPVAQTQHR